MTPDAMARDVYKTWGKLNCPTHDESDYSDCVEECLVPMFAAFIATQITEVKREERNQIILLAQSFMLTSPESPTERAITKVLTSLCTAIRQRGRATPEGR